MHNTPPLAELERAWHPESAGEMPHLEQGVDEAIGQIAQRAPLVHNFDEVVYEMPYLSPEQVACSQQGDCADCQGDQAQDALSGGAGRLILAAVPWVGAFCAATSAGPAGGGGEGSNRRCRVLFCHAQNMGLCHGAAPKLSPTISEDTRSGPESSF